MSKFPAAFLPISLSTDLFDNRGLGAPVTRINVHLPAEFVGNPEPGAVPPYTLKQVDPQLLSEIQSAVVRKYGAAARQYLGAFRQGRDIAGLGVVTRMASLDLGVGVRWKSQMGSEYLDITVSPEVVRNLIGEESGLYMLVLYGDNQIAYVSMDDIANPAGKFEYRRLEESRWETPEWWTILWGFPMRLCTNQVKLSNQWNALSSNIQISSDGVISVPTLLDQTPMYNVSDTLLRSAQSTTPYSDYYGAPSTDLSGFLYSFPPMFNGSGATVYNSRGDKFTWTEDNGVQRESVFSDNFYDGYNITYAISTDGGRYSDVAPFSDGWPVWGMLNNAITNAQNTALQTEVASPTRRYIYSLGPGPSDYSIDKADGSAGDKNLSGTSYLQTYEKDSINKIDKLNVSSCAVSFDYYDLTPFYELTMTNYWGYSAIQSTGPWTWLLGTIQFPYALGTGPEDIYIFYSKDDTHYLRTPYARHDVSSTSNLFIISWIHLSNGKHLLQGYVWDGGTELWLDRVAYGDTLAAAIGCKVDDIRTIFFDIKLDDIRKLK